jgi:hypothetical protein
MSGVLQGPTRTYLLDEEAKDVSRVTGIPWCWQKVHQRGDYHPFIDLTQLDWAAQFQVAWSLIGMNYYLDSTIC